MATPSFYTQIAPPCFAVFLANNWPADAAITIARDGETYSATAFGRVPNGTPDAEQWPAVPASGIGQADVAVLFLSNDPTSHNSSQPTTCPIAPAVASTYGTAVYSGPDPAQTGIGKAWHITTTIPVSAYDVLPYGGAPSALPSAELILPTTAWGTTYVTASPIPSRGPGWGQVVAAQDDTVVQIKPSVALPAGLDVVTAPAHQVTGYHLSANTYIQWQDSGDMAGSIITSNKPISFTGGSDELCVKTATNTGGGCDSAHQQIPPIAALGYEYVAPPYATRRADLLEESIRYRIVGTVDGTQLTFAPAVSGAPATLDVGQVAEVETVGPFVIKSQDHLHPFYVGQYMSGSVVTSGSRPGTNQIGKSLGDEEFVNILPPAQWLPSYVFFIDPTYGTTNLVVMRKATSTGFKDVVVDCLGTLFGWQPVADGTEYEVTNVDIQRRLPVGSCVNGRHVARSDAPFGLVVWGLDSDASYAYPAGGSVGAINPVVVIL